MYVFFHNNNKKSFKNIAFSKYITKSHFRIKWLFTLLNTTLNNSSEREPGEENKPRCERTPCLRTQLFTVMTVHAAVYAQPGGGTVDRLLLGSFFWHKSTRLKGIIQLLLEAVLPRQPCALPPLMMREQLFWWPFEFLWGFDSFGKETESWRLTCLVRAAIFVLQFLAWWLKQTGFLKFGCFHVFCRWPATTVWKLHGIVLHESL